MSYETFIKTVANHKLTIHQDNGLYRHITLKNPRSFNRHFHLTTWPGYLAVSGDMGEWVFSRLSDMFEFHRAEGHSNRISYNYWAEKCQAADRRTDIWAYDEELYVQAIRREMANYLSSFTLSEAKIIVKDAELEGLFDAPCNHSDALHQAMGWTCPVGMDFPFLEFWENQLHSLTPHFKWICHAIQWGIKQYDLEKAGRTQNHHNQLVLKGAI